MTCPSSVTRYRPTRPAWTRPVSITGSPPTPTGALGRTREHQDRAIAGSLNFGAHDVISGEQVGFARVVTDLATFAWLCDVYADRSARGHGVATRIATAARDHPAPTGIRRFMLATEDAHGVYEKVGFKPLGDAHKWMCNRPG